MSKALNRRITEIAEENVTMTVRRDDLVRAERRRVVRYWCYRFLTEATGGAEATGAPRGLRKHFERAPFFRAAGGWRKFATAWDVDRTDPLEMVPRTKSVWDEWDEKLVGTVPLLPKHVDKL